MLGFGPQGAADWLTREPLCLNYPNTSVSGRRQHRGPLSQEKDGQATVPAVGRGGRSIREGGGFVSLSPLLRSSSFCLRERLKRVCVYRASRTEGLLVTRTLVGGLQFFELTQAQCVPLQWDRHTFRFSRNRGKFLPGRSRASSVSVVKKTQISAKMDCNKSSLARWGWVFSPPVRCPLPPEWG